MKASKAFAPLFVVGALSLGLLLSACGSTAAGNSTDSQSAAKNQFLAERGGNATPGAGAAASGTPLAGTGANGGVPRVFGTIAKVDGNTITVTNAADGSQTVVQLTADATVHKEVAAQVSDIKVGDMVTASGTKNGDTLDAQTVQVGGAFGGFGGFANGGGRGFGGPNASGTPGARQNRPFPSGTPGAGFPRQGRANASGTPGVVRDLVAGTVEKIDGDTITLKTQDGSAATFKTSANTRVQKNTQVQPGDITVGANIVATGTSTTASSGGVFEANAVQLVEGFAGRNASATPQP